MPWGLKRFQETGQVHYITSSCYRRRPNLRRDQACTIFVAALERVRRDYGQRIYGYVVMSEHVHLLLNEPERNTFAQAIKSLKQGVARRLALRALAYVLTMGDVSRFQRGKQVASYLGLIPREHSSGGRQKLGAITKQGNRMLRMLLVEAAQIAVRFDPGLRKEYLHRCHHKPKAVAKVAAARKLAVRLYWMLRTEKPYPEVVRIESSPRVPLVGAS